VLAEVYAGAGKTHGLTLEDVSRPATGRFLADIEGAVVHYGSSTGFFGKKMFAGGPTYLSASVLYENMVIESYSAANRDPAFPIVAIYPKEGTFWSDHPVGIVQRPWVTPEHQEAAKAYIAYLLAEAQQRKALALGFRPASDQVPLAAPLTRDFGVDPKEPQNVLPVPEADVMSAILSTWRANKKHADVVLVLDCSGSMRDDNKMTNARIGAVELVKMLGDEDDLSLLPFSTDLHWAGQRMALKTQRDRATNTLNGLIADGNTKLFDSINAAFDFLQAAPAKGRISAIVVLTDGADTNSVLKLPGLLDRVRSDAERKNVRIFTIGYGRDAQVDELKKIADQTQAKYYDGKPENIRQVFRDIATFF
jgi:Ca-activated chloride channel family protein